MPDTIKMCCARCFGDESLRKVIKFASKTKGACSYCLSKQEKLVFPRQLSNFFEVVIGIYKLSADGKTLAEWLRNDWDLFSHPVVDNAHAKELLADILDDCEIVRKKFIPNEYSRSESLDVWEKLRDELMTENRYFPKTSLDEPRLRNL